MLGNFTLAEHHITRALACWEHLRISGARSKIWLPSEISACVKGALVEAEGIFQEALAQARAICFLRGQAYTLSSMSLCYHRQDA